MLYLLFVLRFFGFFARGQADFLDAETFECPNLHFSETLTTELSFTTKRLLSNRNICPDCTRYSNLFGCFIGCVRLGCSAVHQ